MTGRQVTPRWGRSLQLFWSTYSIFSQSHTTTSEPWNSLVSHLPPVIQNKRDPHDRNRYGQLSMIFDGTRRDKSTSFPSDRDLQAQARHSTRYRDTSTSHPRRIALGYPIRPSFGQSLSIYLLGSTVSRSSFAKPTTICSSFNKNPDYRPPTTVHSNIGTLHRSTEFLPHITALPNPALMVAICSGDCTAPRS